MKGKAYKLYLSSIQSTEAYEINHLTIANISPRVDSIHLSGICEGE